MHYIDNENAMENESANSYQLAWFSFRFARFIWGSFPTDVTHFSNIADFDVKVEREKWNKGDRVIQRGKGREGERERKRAKKWKK